MKSNKQDSVQDFLTNTKILSTKMKTANKPKKDKTVIEALMNSNIQSQDGSKKSSSRDAQNQDPDKKNTYSYDQQEPGFIDLVKKQTSSKKQDPNQNIRKSGAKSNEYSGFLMDVDQEEKISRASQKSKEKNSNKYKPIGNYGENQLAEGSKKRESLNSLNSIHSLNRSAASERKESPAGRSFVMPMKKNPEISQLQLKQIVSKILQLKASLENEITELQHLLDNTSTYLQSIDDQYEKIKEGILNYTSQYLDSAFKEYKSNFPDWSKYENVEDQALNKVAEMNQIAEAFRTGKQVDDFSTSYELQKKLEEYQSLIRDVEGARKQCLELRPTITEQKIRKYEAAVIDIGRF